MFRAYKDPSAVLDYKIGWSDELAGDAISTSTWTVPAGITKVSDSNDSTSATVWLSGGTVEQDAAKPKQSYDVVNKIVTSGGRTDERTIQVVMVDK